MSTTASRTSGRAIVTTAWPTLTYCPTSADHAVTTPSKLAVRNRIIHLFLCDHKRRFGLVYPRFRGFELRRGIVHRHLRCVVVRHENFLPI